MFINIFMLIVFFISFMPSFGYAMQQDHEEDEKAYSSSLVPRSPNVLDSEKLDSSSFSSPESLTKRDARYTDPGNEKRKRRHVPIGLSRKKIIFCEKENQEDIESGLYSPRAKEIRSRMQREIKTFDTEVAFRRRVSVFEQINADFCAHDKGVDICLNVYGISSGRDFIYERSSDLRNFMRSMNYTILSNSAVGFYQAQELDFSDMLKIATLWSGCVNSQDIFDLMEKGKVVGDGRSVWGFTSYYRIQLSKNLDGSLSVINFERISAEEAGNQDGETKWFIEVNSDGNVCCVPEEGASEPYTIVLAREFRGPAKKRIDSIVASAGGYDYSRMNFEERLRINRTKIGSRKGKREEDKRFYGFSWMKGGGDSGWLTLQNMHFLVKDDLFSFDLIGKSAIASYLQENLMFDKFVFDICSRLTVENSVRNLIKTNAS